ncbi:MAG TPA: tetratricopeptide repeat protein, partial [Polyangiales bacterium]|nr:tetratricopeptide repeat protein [Polyangiales bacterium]
GFALEHFWTGIGRGAFSSAFASVHTRDIRRFDYAEDFVVQWAAEWGMPLTIALLVAIGLALVSGVRKASTWERCAVIAGTLGLALQNLVDIGFELLAVSVLAAVALACATAERTDTAPRRSATFRTGLSALALATIVAAVTLGPSLMREYPNAVDARVRAAIARGSRQRVMEEVAIGMFAYPSEPSFALLAASDALHRKDPTAGRWINRALQLAPGWASAHAMAATWLWNGGHHKQALLELAAAARADLSGIGQARDFTCRFAEVWTRGVVSVAAKTNDPALFLELISKCPGLTSAQRAEVDHGLLHYDPKSGRARLRQAQRARLEGHLEQALALVREVQKDHPALPDAIVLEGQLLLQMNRLAEARTAIARGARIAPADPRVREIELQILTKLGDRRALTRVFSALRGNAEDAHELAMLYHREAAIDVTLGNPGAALRAYQQAYDIAAEPESLRALASTAQSMGDVNRARRLYAQLCALAPDDVTSCASAKPTEHPSNAVQNSGGR